MGKVQTQRHWKDEIDSKGAQAALLDRLTFHGGLLLSRSVQMTGLSQATVKKHLNRLVDDGRAQVSTLGDDLHYQHQPCLLG